jgi:serine/threonine-protein kinase
MVHRGEALLSDEFDVGNIVAGKYRIESVIGEGGLGRVLAATHLELDQLVAIKHLKEGFADQANVGERFAREARLAARIRSDHVVRVLDVAKTDRGATYIVMEFLEGRDLGAILAASGALKVPEAIDYVLQACEALAEAHSIGVVHRDLKPDNLFLAKRPAGTSILKVLDFGISKVMVAPTGPGPVRPRALTTDTDKLGTPAYMSPEQIRASTDVDVRADIWAIGVVLYELLSGAMPFDSDHIPMLCVQIATEAPLPLRAKRPDLPAALEAAILKCLEKDRDRRYRNVAELAVDLAPFGHADAAARADHVKRVIVEGGGSIRPPPPPFTSPSTVSATTDRGALSPAGSTLSSWAPESVTRRRGVGLIALVATALAGTVIAFFVLRARPPAAVAVGAALPDPPTPAAPPASAEPVAAAPGHDTTESMAPPSPAERLPSAAPVPSPIPAPTLGPRVTKARPAPAATKTPAAAAIATSPKNAEFGDRQ